MGCPGKDITSACVQCRTFRITPRGIMSVCVSSSGPAIGLGSNSGMSLPHHPHHHHHMPGLMQSLTGGGLGGPMNHTPSIAGHPSAMPGHLFHPSTSEHIPPPPSSLLGHLIPPSLPLPPAHPLGTMDSQCPATRTAPGTASETLSPVVPPVSKASSLHTTNSGDDQFPSSDMLLALIARNKALEGESGLDLGD